MTCDMEETKGGQDERRVSVGRLLTQQSSNSRWLVPARSELDEERQRFGQHQVGGPKQERDRG
jgi:hypothetical protein